MQITLKDKILSYAVFFGLYLTIGLCFCFGVHLVFNTDLFAYEECPPPPPRCENCPVSLEIPICNAMNLMEGITGLGLIGVPLLGLIFIPVTCLLGYPVWDKPSSSAHL